MIINLLNVLFSQYVLNPHIDYGKVIDKRDNQSYRTIMVGERKWLGENLNYVTESSWCGHSDSCDVYGRYYTFAKAQTVCMEGYHLPLREEFDSLGSFVGGYLIAGVMLKTTKGFPPFNNVDVNGVDLIGWFGLPNGRRDPNGNMLSSITLNGGNEYYWTSEEKDSYNGWRYLIGHGSRDLSLSADPKGNGFSVRCINDTIFKDINKNHITDTVFLIDTIFVKNYTHDTIVLKDTLKIMDTIRTVSRVYDTLKLVDTVVKIDSIRLATCFDSIAPFTYTEELVSSKSMRDGGISLTNYIERGMIVLKITTNISTINQIYMYDNLGVYVNDKKFRLSPGIHYVTIGNRDSYGRVVSDGIYTIRSVSSHLEHITNNLYLVGISSEQ